MAQVGGEEEGAERGAGFEVCGGGEGVCFLEGGVGGLVVKLEFGGDGRGGGIEW